MPRKVPNTSPLPDYGERFLKQLEAYCIKYDLSDTEAAARLGVLKQELSMIRNRHRAPSVATLAKACSNGQFNLNYTMAGLGKPFHTLHLNVTEQKNKK